MTSQLHQSERKPGRAARVLTGLYPPAWRTRYGEEFTGLLADSAIGPREVTDVVLAAAGAWLRPPPHLHDRATRMRVSISVTLAAWTAWAAGAVLFAKVSHDGALHLADAAHPAEAWLYNLYALASGLSTAAIIIGGLPLALATLRRAAPTERHLTVGLLAVPIIAALSFLGIAAALASLVQPAPTTGGPTGRGLFLALAVLGVTAAFACSTGPAVAVRRSRPHGPAITIAMVAGGCAVALTPLATGASVASDLVRDQHPTADLIAYGVAMCLAFAIGATSCIRGLGAIHRPNTRSGHA